MKFFAWSRRYLLLIAVSGLFSLSTPAYVGATAVTPPHTSTPSMLLPTSIAAEAEPISTNEIPDDSFSEAKSDWLPDVALIGNWRTGYWLIFDAIAALSFCLLVITTVLLIRRLRQDKDGLERAVEERTQTIQRTLRHTELALRTARQSWFEMDIDSGEIWVGDEYPIILDYAPDEFNPTLSTLKEEVHPDDIEHLLKMLNECAETENTTEMEFRRRTQSGYWLWLHAIAEVVDMGNDRKHVIGVITDISRRKHTEILDLARISVLEQLVNNVPLSDIFNSIIEMIENTSRGALCSILLLDEQRKHLHLGAAPSLPDFFNDAVEGLEIGEGVGTCGTAAFLKERVIVENISSHPYWEPFLDLAKQANLEACWSEPIINRHGDVLGTFAIYHARPTIPTKQDLEVINFAARLVMLAMEKTETDDRLRLLSRVFEKADEGIMVTDQDARIVDINPKFSEITGFTKQEALNQNPNILKSDKHDTHFYRELLRNLRDHGSWRGEIWNRKKDGELYIAQLTISSIRNPSGETTHYVGIFSDITQLKHQQQALETMAYHDVLTQLPNRVLLTDRFHQATARCNRTGTLLAICFLDLDNFKQINDRYGHSVGDQMLIQVSERILHCIRDEDTASRLGGDEFAILIGDIHSVDECREVLSRIHQKICEPFLIEGHELNVTASSGITMYPDDQVDIDTLLRHADQAMYRVKLGGKNSFDLFNQNDDQYLIETHNQRRHVEIALRKQQFELYYQPKVNMSTGEVWGLEALIRWRHPEKGLLLPFHFLPVIAGTSVEIDIGHWVLEQALAQLDEWHRAGMKVDVGINVSAFHLLSPDFEAELAKRINRYPDLDTHYVQLEILESTDFGNLDAINTIIEQCRTNLGVSFALDDFGTGFSSLAHLRNLSADNVKIDCSFVTHLMSSPDDFRIVDGVIRLAEAFDRNVVAEGVESVWEGQMLMLMGCENAQGDAIAKPMPANEFPQWKANFQPFPEWSAFKERSLNQRETMIELFRLSLNHWGSKFENALLSNSTTEDEWPVIDQQHSHFSGWRKRCRKDNLITSEALSKIEADQKQLYRLANEIRKQYQEGNVERARQRLPEIQTLIQAIQQQFNELQVFTCP